ncbi:MAG: signal peptidase I [Nocardioides sp.]
MPAGVRWAARVLAWLMILVSLAALAAGVVVPRLGGATPYEILTGSMQPGLPPGTLVVMKPIEGPGDIGVGSVVTYQLRSGESTVVTHRVQEVRQTLSGDVTYITQGDANDVVDELPVRPEQIRGTLWYAVPQLGRVNQLINGDQRQTLIYLLVAGLGGYALSMFATALRDRGRRSTRAGS